MRTLPQLFENNRQWAETITKNQPDFFPTLSRQQSPNLLWIGCSDSRVPANEIVGLLPGELFVHRNVANLVVPSDMNGLSVIQYAVDVLKVRHIIVCGHYGCGGVRAAMEAPRHGLIDNWLGHIRALYHRQREELACIAEEKARVDRLCEINVMEQVKNTGNTTIVQDAWQRRQPLVIHGWMYSISNGLLKDLGLSIASSEELEESRDRGK
ncbi:MAG: carbonate dehydratase [Phycisphaerae bacterium]|nr:carbonate dehydratase [Phycisphaerae bacterium]